MFLAGLSDIEPSVFLGVYDESRKRLLQAAFINHKGKRIRTVSFSAAAEVMATFSLGVNITLYLQ